MNASIRTELPPCLVLVLILVFFTFIILSLSVLSGWRGLQRKFRTSDALPRNRKQFVFGALGAVSYGGCLIVGWAPEGLYLSAIFPLRIFHSKMLIPWPKIKSRTSYRSLGLQWDTLEIGEDHKITLPRRVTRCFESHLPQSAIAP
jgi:hypothetical protein